MNDLPDNELLSAYLDGELTAAEQAEVERLLRRSPRARKTLEELRAISLSLQSLPQRRLGEDLSEDVLRLAECRMLLEPGATTGGAPPAADDELAGNDARADRGAQPEILPPRAAATEPAIGEAAVAPRTEPAIAVARRWDRRRVIEAGSRLLKRLASSRALAWSAAAVAVALLLSVSQPRPEPRRIDQRGLASAPANRPAVSSPNRGATEAMDKAAGDLAATRAPSPAAQPAPSTIAAAPVPEVPGLDRLAARAGANGGRAGEPDSGKHEFAGATPAGERPADSRRAMKSKGGWHEASEEIAQVESPRHSGAPSPARIQGKADSTALGKPGDPTSPALEPAQTFATQKEWPFGDGSVALAGDDYLVVQCDLSAEAAATAAFQRVLASNSIHWEAEEDASGRQLALARKQDSNALRQVAGGQTFADEMDTVAQGGHRPDDRETERPSLEELPATAQARDDTEGRHAPEAAASSRVVENDHQPAGRQAPRDDLPHDAPLPPGAAVAQSVPGPAAPDPFSTGAPAQVAPAARGTFNGKMPAEAPAGQQTVSNAPPVGPLELVLVEASASQIEATLRQLAAAPDQFVNLSIEPAPGAESQNQLRQYERRRELGRRQLESQLALGAADHGPGGARAATHGPDGTRAAPHGAGGAGAATEGEEKLGPVGGRVQSSGAAPPAGPRAPASTAQQPMAEKSQEPTAPLGKHSDDQGPAVPSQAVASQPKPPASQGESLAARDESALPYHDQYRNVQNRAGRARRIPLVGGLGPAENRQSMMQNAGLPPAQPFVPSPGGTAVPAREPAPTAPAAPPPESPLAQPALPSEPMAPPTPPPAWSQRDPLARQPGSGGATGADQPSVPLPTERPQSSTGQAAAPAAPGQLAEEQAAQTLQTIESPEPTYRVLFVLRVAPAQTAAEAAARAGQLDASQSAAEDRSASEANWPAAAPPAAEAPQPAEQ